MPGFLFACASGREAPPTQYTVALRCLLRTSGATIAPHQKPNPKRKLVVQKRGDLENAPRAAARARSGHGGFQIEFPDDQFGGKARLQRYDPGNRRGPGGEAFSGELAGH